MKWRDRKQSTNVDDRRSRSGGGGGGRGLPSIGTLMFLWPLIKPLLRSKLGLAVVGIGAAAYFLAPTFMGSGSSKPADVAADDEQAALSKQSMATLKRSGVKSLLRQVSVIQSHN